MKPKACDTRREYAKAYFAADDPTTVFWNQAYSDRQFAAVIAARWLDERKMVVRENARISWTLWLSVKR